MQVLQAALKKGPVLLVLDNVSRDTAEAALPLLAPRAPGSLVLATSWYADIFADISELQLQQGQQLTLFQPLPMAEDLVLQQADAVELIQQQLQLSRQLARKPTLTHEHAAALAERAAHALAFPNSPVYVPKVLSVSASALGRMAEDAGALDLLLQQLREAKEPTGPRSTKARSVEAAKDQAVFSQLRACYHQLTLSAQQIFVDLAVANQQHADLCSLNQLALWLSCRHEASCSMEEARGEVCPAQDESQDQSTGNLTLCWCAVAGAAQLWVLAAATRRRCASPAP